MIVVIVAGCLIGAGLLCWKALLKLQYSKEVAGLFSKSEAHSGQKFDSAQFPGLPAPVLRYFKHVLKNGQPYINTARLTHDGQFKSGLDKPWADITGEQYFTTRRPGFIWKGKTTQFTAIDEYVAGKGRLQVFLMSLARIANGHGEKYNQGELLRWLSESVWFPTNLLPSEVMQWSAMSDSTAKLAFSNEGQAVSCVVTFNQADEIAGMETKRYMGEDKLETWLTKMSDYKEWNGVKIPTRAEALWRLDSGDFSYAKFRVKTLEYEVSKEF